MKKFTRLISFVVAMVMASSLMTTGVFATETSSTIIELMDFGNPANFEASVCTHPTAEVSAFAYPGKSSSLKYTMSKGTNSDVDMLKYLRIIFGGIFYAQNRNKILRYKPD